MIKKRKSSPFKGAFLVVRCLFKFFCVPKSSSLLFLKKNSDIFSPYNTQNFFMSITKKHRVDPSNQLPLSDKKKKKLVEFQSPPSFCPDGLVVVGTYHGVMAALVLQRDRFLLRASTKHHTGCIHSIAACGKYLVTSGSDEKLFAFTLKNGATSINDLGNVGTKSEVMCCSFPSTQHLLCGCSDGNIVGVKTRDWEPLWELAVHEKSVVDVAFVPFRDGNVAVSVGRDRFMAVLDMIHGSILTRVKLPKNVEPLGILFSVDGRWCAIVSPFEIRMYDSSDFTLRHILKTPTSTTNCQIHCATFLPQSEDHQHCHNANNGEEVVRTKTTWCLIAGCENGKLYYALVHEEASPSASECTRPPLAQDDEQHLQQATKKNKKRIGSNSRSGEDVISQTTTLSKSTLEKNNNKKYTTDKPPVEALEVTNISLTECAVEALEDTNIRVTEKEVLPETESNNNPKSEENEKSEKKEDAPVMVPPQNMKHPTMHAARIKALVLLTAPKSFVIGEKTTKSKIQRQDVVLAVDSEGCMIAWKCRREVQRGLQDQYGIVIQNVASCNLKGRVTSLAFLPR